MKSVGVYGAEIESQGFSGYAAEVLIIRFDDFEGVLRYFADFKPHSAEESSTSPILWTKEVDLARASLPRRSSQGWCWRRGHSSRNPSQQYFSDMRQRRRPPPEASVVGLVFTHAALSEDTLWGELKRTAEHLETHTRIQGIQDGEMYSPSRTAAQSSAFLFIPRAPASLPEVSNRESVLRLTGSPRRMNSSP